MTDPEPTEEERKAAQQVDEAIERFNKERGAGELNVLTKPVSWSEERK